MRRVSLVLGLDRVPEILEEQPPVPLLPLTYPRRPSRLSSNLRVYVDKNLVEDRMTGIVPSLGNLNHRFVADPSRRLLFRQIDQTEEGARLVEIHIFHELIFGDPDLCLLQPNAEKLK